MKFVSHRRSTGDSAFIISLAQQQKPQDKPAASPPRPRNPALHRLHKFRTVVLPILLVLAFVALILGAIYAYCVAKPHTDIADQLARDPSAEANSSIFGKRETPGEATAATKPISNSTSAPREAQPDTALLFYTLTAPSLAIIHLLGELLVHHNTPRHLTLRPVYIVLLGTSSLLIAGWVVSLSFWMHCELPSLSRNGQAVCPVQVRGHFMYGIHEVSIARAVVGWILVVGYAMHVLVLTGGYRAQRRLWRVLGTVKTEVVDGEPEHGEARLVVVRFDENTGRHGDGPGALNKEATAV